MAVARLSLATQACIRAAPVTLLVGRANAAGLLLAADSRACYVTRDAMRARETALPASPLDGVLKVIVLNHSQCVGFAGEVQPAQDAIARMVSDRIHLLLDDEVILARLLETHLASRGATDFLFGSVVASARLHEIRGGSIARDVGASWLGSQAAFAEYQRLYLAPRSAPADGAQDAAATELSRMSDAMHLLLEGERGFDDVGDFLIRVRSRPHGLVYLPYASAAFPPSSTSSQEWTRVNMGSAATGAYSYGVLCPTAAGIPVVAVYFGHGGFGTVFAPFHARDPVLIEAESPERFVERVERSIGYELCGTVILSDRAVTLRRHDPAGHEELRSGL